MESREFLGELPEGLVEEVKREEGFVAKVYLDSMGNRTIGYGTLLEEGISKAEAEMLLVHRLSRANEELLRAAENGAARAYPGLPPRARRAILGMAYNMGAPALLGFGRMWAALAAGDYGRAAAEILDSKYAAQVPARARRMADMVRGCAAGRAGR